MTHPQDCAALGRSLRSRRSSTVVFRGVERTNLTAFGTGKQSDYFSLYRYTVEAIKSVDNSLQVGGPATADNAWISDFLDFCDSNGMPADFISTHHYPTDCSASRATIPSRSWRTVGAAFCATGARGSQAGGRFARLLYRVVHIVQSARSHA